MVVSLRRCTQGYSKTKRERYFPLIYTLLYLHQPNWFKDVDWFEDVVRWLILNGSFSSRNDAYGVIDDMLMRADLHQVNILSFDGSIAFFYKGHTICSTRASSFHRGPIICTICGLVGGGRKKGGILINNNK